MKTILKLNGDIEQYADGTIKESALSPVFLNILEEEFDVVKTPYIPKIGDKIYFLPGVNIPRVKLKKLILDYNIKIVKNIEDSTVIFGSVYTKSKLIEREWEYATSLEVFKMSYAALKPSMDVYYSSKVDTALEFYTGDSVCLNWQSVGTLADETLSIYKNLTTNPGDAIKNARSSLHLDVIKSSYIPIMQFLEDNPQVIFDDSELIAHINGDDAILINAEVYEQLCNMFKSSDTDNHVLAMEIMSNSNYKESLLYLQLIFKEHSRRIGDSHTKNHVNFKSLLSYLGKDNYNLGSDLDTIVNSLKDKGVLTVEKLTILMDKYHTEISSQGNTHFFNVKNITISDEIAAIVNSNFVYNVKEYFIPVEIIQTEEPAIAEETPIQWL